MVRIIAAKPRGCVPSTTTGTKVQGFAKHELSENWVPAQLWVVNKNGNDYTIENANSRTLLTLGMLPPVHTTVAYETLQIKMLTGAPS